MKMMPLPLVRLVDLKSVGETRPAALIAPRGDWATVRHTLELPLLVQAEPTETTLSYLEFLATSLPSHVEVIYTVGRSALALDAAKFVANTCQKPLIVVPTALYSADLFSPYAQVGEERRLVGPASEVLIDLALVGAEGDGLGLLSDAMSSITALMDWGYAMQSNKTTPETKFNAWAASLAANFAQQSLKLAGGTGKKDPETLRSLIELACLSVQLDNVLGHERATRSTEHIIADCAGDTSDFAEYSYPNRVALGIVLAAALHKKDTAPLRAALEAAGFKLHGLTKDALRGLLNILQFFAQQHKLPHGIAHDLHPHSDEVEQAITKSGLA
ncbi:MAG: hypothetical protein OHK0023_02420 [Anaerolineae bacterium]